MVVTVPVSEVAPDKPTAIRVDEDLTVAICHVQGTYYALENKCPHKGAPLADGVVEGNLIVCPKHHLKFDVATGRCTMPRHLRVQTFSVSQEGDVLQIHVPPADQPVASDDSPA